MSIIRRFAFGLALSLIALGALAEPIDINTATAEQIAASLVGIGKAKAEAIVQDREKNGPFHSVDDLARIKGIKGAIIAKNRDKIAAGAGASAPAVPASPAKAIKPKVSAKPAV